MALYSYGSESRAVPLAAALLDSLKEITDSGRAILDGSKSHLDTQSELLKAVASGSAEG